MGKRKKKKNKQYFERFFKEPVRERFTVMDYIIMNLVVWVFISLVALCFYISSGFKVDSFQIGVFRYIFLYTFGSVFFIVSAIDYSYGKGRKV